MPALVAEHRPRNADATLHLTPVADPSAFGVVEIDDDGRVRRFLEKPAPGVTESTLINGGVYVMEPTVLDSIPTGQPVNVERVTFPALADRGTLFGVATDDYWIDVGRPDLLLQANLDRLAGRYDTTMSDIRSAGVSASIPTPSWRSMRWCREASSPRDVEVGARSVVTTSVLLAGARVGDDVVVQDSVVMGAVADGAQLSRAVVGAAANIEPGQQVTDERLPDPS